MPHVMRDNKITINKSFGDIMDLKLNDFVSFV